MKPYFPSLHKYIRFKTRVVKVGDLEIGGDNPIRIQSMTTTPTMDTMGTVAQSIRLIEAGSELVRITAPNIEEAKNLLVIKDEIRKSGFNTPLVADIHFTPNAAEIAARIVEKVRINPGNYADKKKFEVLEYDDASYEREIERIRKKFLPLVKVCKEYGTAMRIGTNHGSLSDRILSRYGDTPLGMVESAMEFVNICREENYHNIVLSMKASNPGVIGQEYRLMVSRMMELDMNYPLHLGVTESGEGEDGRIKSALGIGSLLEDGLGDTIRVSLTEEPEKEIPVARKIVSRYSFRISDTGIPPLEAPPFDPFSYQKRESRAVENIGGSHRPVVIADLVECFDIKPETLLPLGYKYMPDTDKWKISDQACDYMLVNRYPEFELPGTLRLIVRFELWKHLSEKERIKAYPILDAGQYVEIAGLKQETLKFISVEAWSPGQEMPGEKFWEKLSEDYGAVICLCTENPLSVAAIRRFLAEMKIRSVKNPVIFVSDNPFEEYEEMIIHYSIESGPYFLDGWGDGIALGWKEIFHPVNEMLEVTNRCAFGILQAARARISKTEYISCPSCGRTLFDLQETTAKIRQRTAHLKGLKIGIMGCIVNGPGEMADADYGYVGTGIGQVTLYKKKEVVKRNIPSEKALDELIALIKENGDWVEAVHE